MAGAVESAAGVTGGQIVDGRFDMWDPSHRPDPHRLYRDMRVSSPVHPGVGPITGRTFWFLTRYDDCVTALKASPGVIGKDFEKHLDPEQVAAQQVAPDALVALNRHMLNLDPPDHTRLRRLVQRAFTAKSVEQLSDHIADIASDLIEELDGDFDLISRFALPLPVTVIAEMLGVPVGDRDRFRVWTEALLRADTIDDAAAAGMEFIGYLNGLIEDRRGAPRDDLLSRLIEAEEEGDRLDHIELISMVFLLLVAGHETTVNLIGNGTLALLENPEQLALLREDPSLLPGAVEEMLRYNGPVESTTMRWAFEDVTIGGTVIPKGDLVVPLLLAANRDPEVFDRPDEFDVERQPNRHIAFGQGIHYCLGAPLARLEADIAFRLLLDRFPRLELGVARDDLEWTPDFFLRGVRSLPVLT